MKHGVVFSLLVLVACERPTRSQVSVDLSGAVNVLRQAQISTGTAGGDTGDTGSEIMPLPTDTMKTETMPAVSPDEGGDAGVIPDALPGASTTTEEKRSTFTVTDPALDGYLIRFDAWCTEAKRWTIQRETFFSLDKPEALAELEPCGPARLWVTVFHLSGEPIAALSGSVDVTLADGDQEVRILTDKIGELDVGLFLDGECELSISGQGMKTTDTLLGFQRSRFYLLPGQYEVQCTGTNRLGETKTITETAEVRFAERTTVAWQPDTMTGGTIPGGNTGDTTPPAIATVTVHDVTQIGVSIDWSTSELAACAVELSRDPLFTGIDRTQTFPSDKMFTVSFTGLSPNQKYFFRIRCTDAALNVGSYEGDFTTLQLMMNVLNITGELTIAQHVLARDTTSHTFTVDFDDGVQGLSNANFSVSGVGAVIAGVGQSDADSWTVTVIGLEKGGVYSLNVQRNFSSVNGRQLAAPFAHPFRVENRLFVDAGATGVGDGLTPATPFGTLFEACGAATPGDVIVATVGDYDLGSSTLQVPPNVRLIGSFKDTSYSSRSFMPDSGSSAPEEHFTFTHSTSLTGVFAVSGPMHSTTEIDGFYINSDATTGATSSAVKVSAGASVRIINNLIFGPQPSGTSTTAAVDIVDGQVNLFNNVINAGCGSTGSATSYGVRASSGGAKIIGNTIYLGSLDGCLFTTSSAAISYGGTVTPRIINNVLFVSGSGLYAVREAGPANPAALQNNFFLVNNVGGVYLDDGSTPRSTALALDALGAAYSGNIVETTLAVNIFTEIDGGDNLIGTLHDNDWRPKAMDLGTIGVRSGGQTSVGEICAMGPCLDLAEQPRTLTGGFTIGAYEVD